MEQNNAKFRLRLNLFDGIVLVLALAVGAFLLWTALKPAAPAAGDVPAAPAAGDVPAAETATVRYTVRFQRWLEGTGALVEAGDLLVDNIKNYDMGQVVAAEVVPTTALLLNEEEREYVLSTLDGYEDVLVTVEAPCTVDEEFIVLGGGYTLRVGAMAYIRGEGYMASGPIISIEREGM